MLNAKDDPMFGDIPRWDGKIVLAAIFIVGYFTLVLCMVLGKSHIDVNTAQLVRDAMLTLGPGIGLILGALFRTTAAEERTSAMRSADLRTAIETPSTIAPTATANAVEDGARDGTRAGVEDALGNGGNSGVSGAGTGASGGPTTAGTEIIE
jgi:hypothetical protein